MKLGAGHNSFVGGTRPADGGKAGGERYDCASGEAVAVAKSRDDG